MSKESKKETSEKQGALGANERWSARRKRDVVLRLLRGEPLDAVSREVGVEIYRLEQWREKAVLGIDEALKDRAGDPLPGNWTQPSATSANCRWKLNCLSGKGPFAALYPDGGCGNEFPGVSHDRQGLRGSACLSGVRVPSIHVVRATTARSGFGIP